MSTKLPADPSMERDVNPARPAAAPIPRKPAAPPPRSGFQRFVLQFLLLVIALGGAFGTGYLVNANEMQLNRSDLLQQQLDAQERILALEQQIAELRETRQNGNRVELDLTEVFEPIREAVGRIALVRMGEISRELTAELTRLVESDLPALDDSADASGAATPGAMPGGMSTGDSAEQTPGPEAASAAGEPVVPQSGGGPDSLQPDSAAFDAAESPKPAVELAGSESENAAPPPVTAAPAASLSSPANESSAADILGLPAASEEPVAEEAAASATVDRPAGGSGTEPAASRSTQAKPTDVADLLETPRPPGLDGAVPTTDP